MANPFSATPGAANPFGTPAAPAGGGLFGATPAASKPAGGGLFGAATPAPAASGTSLFGATPGAPAGGGLFGATPSAPKPAGGGLFGVATPAPAASGSSLLLGGGTGLFGAPAPAAAGGGLFGAPAAAAALGGGLFGAPAPAAPALGGGLFGAPAAAPAQPQAAAAPPTVLDQDIFNQFLQQMEAAFNAGKPHQCSFKHMFYDDLTQADGTPPTPQELATRRQQAQAQADPGLWERAEAHNPDPARFCPVQARGR